MSYFICQEIQIVERSNYWGTAASAIEYAFAFCAQYRWLRNKILRHLQWIKPHMPLSKCIIYWKDTFHEVKLRPMNYCRPQSKMSLPAINTKSLQMLSPGITNWPPGINWNPVEIIRYCALIRMKVHRKIYFWIITRRRVHTVIMYLEWNIIIYIYRNISAT